MVGLPQQPERKKQLRKNGFTEAPCDLHFVFCNLEERATELLWPHNWPFAGCRRGVPSLNPGCSGADCSLAFGRNRWGVATQQDAGEGTAGTGSRLRNGSRAHVGPNMSGAGPRWLQVGCGRGSRPEFGRNFPLRRIFETSEVSRKILLIDLKKTLCTLFCSSYIPTPPPSATPQSSEIEWCRG